MSESKVLIIGNGLSGGSYAQECAASHVSFNAGGFTVNMDDACTTAATLNYIAAGGSDIDPRIVTLTLPAALDSSYTICASGCDQTATIPITADFGLFALSGLNALDTVSTSSAFGLGFTDGTNAALANFRENDAQATSVNWTYSRAADAQLEVLAGLAGSSPYFRASHITFNQVGGVNAITWNVAASAGANIVFGLLIAGGRHHVGVITLPSGSTADLSETGAGFQPEGLVLASVNRTAQSASDTSDDGMMFSLGAATSATARAASVTNSAGGIADNTLKCSFASTSLIWLGRDVNCGSDGTMDFKTFDADGFTLDSLTGPSGNRLMWYWAMAGNEAAAGGDKAISGTGTVSGTGTIQ